MEARALLEYGAEHEGYWTGDKFMKNVKDAARIIEFKYLRNKYTITWILTIAAAITLLLMML